MPVIRIHHEDIVVSTNVVKDYSRRYLSCYKNKIVWLYKSSAEAHDFIKDESLDFVYIDGDHRTDIVIKDIRNYWYKVKEDGFIGGHDINKTEVKKAINMLFGTIEDVNYYGKDWWIKKSFYTLEET